MTKTLEEAIGCWTVNRDYNSLPQLARGVSEAARWCRQKTLRGRPHKLLRDLRLLCGRLEAMLEVTNDAIRRCEKIINTDEVEPTP